MLNPQAPPFFPYPKSYPISPEPFHQDVSLPPPPDCFYLYHPTITLSHLPPPFLPYEEQSYVLKVAGEGVHHLHTETTIINCEKQEVDSKGVSKQRSVSAFINGCGRRMQARRTNGFHPPPLARRANGKGQRIQERTLGNSRVFPGNNKAKHPLVPVQPEGNTTIMIRNIPNKYTRAMLIEFLDDHCLTENQKRASEQEGEERVVSAYDLVYLPIDFRHGIPEKFPPLTPLINFRSSRMNKGYAFVNFTSPEGAWKFYLATKNKKWEYFQSQKVCDNVAARLQGKEKLVSHLNSMTFPSDWDEVLPVCFSPPRDGTIKGSQRTLGKQIRVNNNGAVGSASGSQWKETPPLTRRRISS